MDSFLDLLVSPLLVLVARIVASFVSASVAVKVNMVELEGQRF